MMSREKDLEKEALVPSIVGPMADQQITNTRRKDYTLNTAKAIGKKLNACDRRVSVKDKSGNLVISLSTAGFEAFKNIILENVHLPGPRSSARNVEYIKDDDMNGLYVIDILRAHSWQAFKDSLSKRRKGACCITINMHLTKSKVVINGKDYIKKEISSLLDAIRSSPEICNANKVIKSTLVKAKVTNIPPPALEKQLLTMTPLCPSPPGQVYWMQPEQVLK